MFTKVEATQDRQFVVRDEIPVGAHDNRGLSGFYLSVGWVVGGYLLAAAIGLFIGAPKTLRQASAHTGVIAIYSIISGALGALITSHVLGTFAGHWFPLWILGNSRGVRHRHVHTRIARCQSAFWQSRWLSPSS